MKVQRMLELPPDITYCLEIIAFFVFAMILRQLIIVPTQEVLAKRDQCTTGAQEQSARMREEAAEMRLRLARAFDDARLAGSQAGAQSKRDAEAVQREMIEQARADASSVLAAVRAQVVRETQDARAILRAEAEQIARLAAEKILGRPVT